ncbi:Retrovirus-related Pol polyprotein from transposon 412, partial [Acropora cervicornis]
NKFRLCLDPKDRNKHFRREYYYSTTVNEISLSLHGKNYFLVVDTTNGYGYVELDHESGLLFTLNTPFGRCRFKRLPHVMVVSQDIFQQNRRHHRFGSTKEELDDQIFISVFEATRANNVSLNAKKRQFKQQSVNCFDHTVIQDGILPAADKL